MPTPDDPRLPRILELRAQGHTYKQIGLQLGIHANRVGQIVRQAELKKLISELDQAHPAT